MGPRTIQTCCSGRMEAAERGRSRTTAIPSRPSISQSFASKLGRGKGLNRAGSGPLQSQQQPTRRRTHQPPRARTSYEAPTNNIVQHLYLPWIEGGIQAQYKAGSKLGAHNRSTLS